MKKEHAFTLIELLVTMAIAAILLTVGVPSMRDLISNNRLSAATNTFVSSFHMARSEAIKQGRNATVCVSDDPANPACTGQTNWQLGWIVWIDSNSNGVLDAPDEVLRVVEPLPNTINITLNAAQTSFQIDAQGSVNNPNTTLTLCDDRTGEIGRQLRIMATGGVSLNSQVACI